MGKESPISRFRGAPIAQSHFLSLEDRSREEIELLFEESAAIKANPEGYTTALAGRPLGMVAADVIDGPQSVVFDEAENRLHVQKAVLVTLMGQEE